MDELIGFNGDARLDEDVARRRNGHQPEADVSQGVTVSWLATAFGLDEPTVRRRLTGCPVIGRRNAARVYPFREAVTRLVDPDAIQVDAYLRRVKIGDLPAHLQAPYWDAQLKRQKWLLNAGSLWHTEQVRIAFLGVMKAVREGVRMWIDTVEENTEVTPQQREILVRMVDGLLKEIHQRVVEFAGEKRTPPAAVDLDD